MAHDDPLMVGMFWGGLLVASVPMLLTVGIGYYILKRYLEGQREGSAERGSIPETPPGR